VEMPIIDIGFSMNIFKSAVCFYGFILFIWWWHREGKASTVYACITFLLLGLGLDNAVEAYARYMWINYGIDEFRKTIWWPLRLVPSTLVLCGLVWHLTTKALKSMAKVED
jgi:hypothetical protein